MAATVRATEWGYWGSDACGNHQIDLSLLVSREGQRQEVGKLYNSYVYPPRDLSPIMNQLTYQWAMGRFFSGSIDKVLTVDKTSKNRLHVTALGRAYSGANGKWDLEIEPAAAWIVRKAKFYAAASPAVVFAEMANEGVTWSGSYCIPKDSYVNFLGPLEDMKSSPGATTVHLAFEPAVEEFDSTLYSRSQEAVLRSNEPKLTLTDGRVSPAIVSQPNLPDLSLALTEGSSNAGRQWFLTVNIVVVAGILAAIAYRRWWKSDGIPPA
ncbi:hypothetical protein PLANPX_5179 [Lacipirellula parvula]|uniref:Uncharacterized protein n=2 Tax=Lacipirellula parvula TaxID=2650471 RepID=A0A5K7XHV9_9BACT|nr:hypothetical protein PLANPX_5179 [Lacipirellula parvula]